MKSRCPVSLMRGLPLLPWILLAACSSPQPAGTLNVSEVTALHQLPPAPQGPVRISASLRQDGAILGSTTNTASSSGSVVLTKMQTSKIRTAYSLPGLPPQGASGSFPVTPSLPTKYQTVTTGWSLELIPQRDHGFITVTAHVKHISLNPRQGVYGEGSGRVVGKARDFFGSDTYVILTNNQAEIPSVVTEESSVIVRTLPGKEYQVPLAKGTSLVLSVAHLAQPSHTAKVQQKGGDAIVALQERRD